VFILYVVWTALFLYLITLRAGAFETLRKGFVEFSRNELFLVLAIGWVFSTSRHPRTAGDAGQGRDGLRIGTVPLHFLTVIAILASGVPPITAWLSRWQIGLPFPAVETGHGLARGAAAPYAPFALLTHPGTFVLLTALVSLLVYRWQGYYAPRRQQESGLWANLVKDSVPSSIAIASFLTMSKLMDHSGQTTILAQGLAAVATPTIYAFAANWVAILGGFMTSSSTASNILFSPMQAQAVEALPGLSQSAVLAAQGAGGTVGNVIAPANIVIGTGAARIGGQEGAILRRTLPWAIVAGVVTGLATILLNVL
jgi:lactate permease